MWQDIRRGKRLRYLPEAYLGLGRGYLSRDGQAGVKKALQAFIKCLEAYVEYQDACEIPIHVLGSNVRLQAEVGIAMAMATGNGIDVSEEYKEIQELYKKLPRSGKSLSPVVTIEFISGLSDAIRFARDSAALDHDRKLPGKLEYMMLSVSIKEIVRGLRGYEKRDINVFEDCYFRQILQDFEYACYQYAETQKKYKKAQEHKGNYERWQKTLAVEDTEEYEEKRVSSIRVFVSSTFKDMQEERDILHERVLPEVQAEASKFGIHVSLCDLRWGIYTGDLSEDEEMERILSVCYDEIDDCRPYLIGILGERYGTVSQKTGEEKSVTEMEIDYGVLKRKHGGENARFYFRSMEGAVPESYSEPDPANVGRMAALKKKLEDSGAVISNYTVCYENGRGGAEGIEAFAKLVKEDLLKMVQKISFQYEDLPEFERDKLQQWSYAREKVQQFAAREKLVERCLMELATTDRCIAVTGASGIGKSTLMSKLAWELRQDSDTEVLLLFCGLTPASNDAIDLVKAVTYCLEDLLELNHEERHGETQESGKDSDELFSGEHAKADMENGIGEPGKEDDKEETEENSVGESSEEESEESWQIRRMNELVELYNERPDTKRLVILFDALDQLSEDALRDNLSYIPAVLTGKVKCVVSALDSFAPVKKLSVQKVTPFNKEEARAAIDGILSHYKKSVDEEVIDEILKKQGGERPLYLSLVMQRLNMMDRYDLQKDQNSAPDKDYTKREIEIIRALPEALEELGVEIMREAEKKSFRGISGGNGKKAANFLHTCMEYLAVSRYGLRESDLEAILKDQKSGWNSLEFSIFYRYLRSFFIRRDDGRIDFSHKIFREGLLGQLDRKREVRLHKDILNYFGKQKLTEPIKLREYLYHCCRAGESLRVSRLIVAMKKHKEVLSEIARELQEQSMLDGGAWLDQILRESLGVRDVEGYDLLVFCNYSLYKSFKNVEQGLEARLHCAKGNVRLANQLMLIRTQSKKRDAKRELAMALVNLSDVYKEMKKAAGKDKKKAQEYKALALEWYLKAQKLIEEVLAFRETASRLEDLKLIRNRIANCK